MVWICYSESQITITLKIYPHKHLSCTERKPRYCVNKADAPKSFHTFSSKTKQTMLWAWHSTCLDIITKKNLCFHDFSFIFLYHQTHTAVFFKPLLCCFVYVCLCFKACWLWAAWTVCFQSKLTLTSCRIRKLQPPTESWETKPHSLHNQLAVLVRNQRLAQSSLCFLGFFIGFCFVANLSTNFHTNYVYTFMFSQQY